MKTLGQEGAVAVVHYNSTRPDPLANDIWPQCRSTSKLPTRYNVLEKLVWGETVMNAKRRASNVAKSDTLRSPRPIERAPAKARYLEHDPIGRPEWRLPAELVELITYHLNRDDVKALRLVSRELNHYVSQVVFQTVVVPFNTEIYGMLGPEPKADLKGKRRADTKRSGYIWKNDYGDDVYIGHGLDVFKGFGQHILRYGMSFEVTEASLASPPPKTLTEMKTSFWGDFAWPFEEYCRFDAVAGLETAADETPRMIQAFSELSKVRELALSIDSGLGWLNGPDQSIRARVLQRPLPVFGSLKPIPDRLASAQHALWDHIQERHKNLGSDVRLAMLYNLNAVGQLHTLKETYVVASDQPDTPYIDPHLICEATPLDAPDVDLSQALEDNEARTSFIQSHRPFESGVLFSAIPVTTLNKELISAVVPATLSRAQQEWLMETEWAQRAFMSSYMLSIIDNPGTFKAVHTLNIARLSDGYLPMLNRSDFWNSLPSLTSVTLLVLPSWRVVQKDEAGFASTPTINPTHSVDTFYDLISTHIATQATIRNLTIGWAAGGEHSEGMHARNRLILPAPVMALGVRADSIATSTSDLLTIRDPHRLGQCLLQLPSIEKLTLKNCWITPPVLLQFVKMHDSHSLKSLVLDSVSLTAILQQEVDVQQVAQQMFAGLPQVPHPVPNQLGGNNAQIPPGQQQILQLYVQALQTHLQQLHGNQHANQHVLAFQQQLQQHIQFVQGQYNLPPLVPGAVQGAGQSHPQVVPHQPVAAVAAAAAALQQQIQNLFAPLPMPPHTDTSTDPQIALKAKPRSGSWVNVIDIISPGTNLSDFGSSHSMADRDRKTALQSVQFISCGYARLPHLPYDQPGIHTGHGVASALRSPVLTRRRSSLAPLMLSTKWAHFGKIVQDVNLSEFVALDTGWNLKTGWDDVEAAKAPEFDGFAPGGTGRFTGVVCCEDKVADSASAS